MSKKFIAIISALALVVTLLAPVGVQEASAASKNSVDRVITVSQNTYFDQSSGLVPKLTIEDEDGDFGTSEVFRVELPSSAKWNYGALEAELGNKVTRITDQIAQFDIAAADLTGGKYIIPLYLELSGASGELRVRVNPMDSALTGGSYTFANAQPGATVVTVSEKETISRGGNKTGASIIIDEAVVGSLKKGPQEFRLRLPNHFEWDLAGTDVKLDSHNNGFGTTATYDHGQNKRDLIVKFTVTSETKNRRGSITITPVVNASRDARFGEVTVSITNIKGDVSSTSGLVIAEYGDYATNVEIEEVKEFVAGKYNEDYRTAKIKIKESVENSFANNRVIDFELPSWAKIVSGSTINVTSKYGSNFTIEEKEIYGDRSKFEIEVTEGKFGPVKGNKREIEFELPLTFSANKSGDVELKVSGAGVESQEVKIAEVIAPVTAEVHVSDVRLGLQSQAVAEIILKENVAGAIKDLAGDQDLVLEFANDLTAFRIDSVKAEVIEGDLELDEVGRTNNNRAIKVGIDAESEEASTIRFYDLTVTVDRNAPEGLVQLDIKGNGLVENNIKPYDGDFSSRVERFDFVNVITPAPGDVRGTSVFTIDSTTYTVIESGKEVERTMDVAPYIRDSRTFLPVFFVAQSLGVPEQNIVWEPHSKTVTIYKGDRIAQMQIGNKVLTVNGTSIQMDTAPEIKDGRTMLPIYFVGQALGASVEWDGDARTVTVNQ